MLEELKQKVLEANLELVRKGLVIYTWGNVSGIDREKRFIVIKPGGIPYDEMKREHMVVVDLEGNIVEGCLKPSSDTPTHLVLYKAFSGIGAVVHTHSHWATQWAQAGLGIPCYGTTHADYFYGEIPCTRPMTDEETNGFYELETGNVIIESFKDRNPMYIPAVLVNSHGTFTWGKDAGEAVRNSVVLEETARLAHNSLALNPGLKAISPVLLDKHFLRKHGTNAYYGQKKK